MEHILKTAGQTSPESMRNGQPLLEVDRLKMYFPIVRGLFSAVKGYNRAVDDVSFHIATGETVGLVGESGCGKTTIGRCILRAYQPTGGAIRYYRPGGDGVDLAALSREELRPYRKDIRMIFQDPYASLNPRMTVFDLVSEVLRVNKLLPESEIEDRVREVLRQVGLREEFIRRYPHAFSGGERQRIVIARALVTEPKLIVADEAVSALDVSIRAQVLNLMEDLRSQFNLTYLFISHDLSVIRHICDRVIVMYVGRVVEIASVKDLFQKPLHPYTEALMSAVPVVERRKVRRQAGADPEDMAGEEQSRSSRRRSYRIHLKGEVADPGNPPGGCYFHPRCQYAQECCQTEAPPLRMVAPGRWAACHFAETLNLNGIGE